MSTKEFFIGSIIAVVMGIGFVLLVNANNDRLDKIEAEQGYKIIEGK